MCVYTNVYLQVFFLDHSTKTTTFIDPRLPTVQPALNPGHQMPLPRNKYRVPDSSADGSEPISNLPTGIACVILQVLRALFYRYCVH